MRFKGGYGYIVATRNGFKAVVKYGPIRIVVCHDVAKKIFKKLGG